MNASGVGGEGGPPLFNLALLCQQAQGGQGSVHFPFGTVTQGDGITGFTPPAGTPGGGIGVTCGPDGGCMYSR